MTKKKKNPNAWHILVLPLEDMAKMLYEKTNIFKMPADSELAGYTYVVPKTLSWPTIENNQITEWNIKIPPTWIYKLRAEKGQALYGEEIELTPPEFLHVMFGGSLDDIIGTLDEEWSKGEEIDTLDEEWNKGEDKWETNL